MAIIKSDIDNYFTSNYDDLLLYAKKLMSKHRVVGETPEFFLSEAYMYVVERVDEIDDTQDLRNYIGTFLHRNSYWTNGVREAENKSRRIKYIVYDPEDFINITDAIDEDELFEIEKLNEYKSVIEMYYQSLTSLEKKAVWEIYFEEKKRTAKEFAEYIQMSTTTAYMFIKQLKQDIREYYQKYKEVKQDTI